MFFMFAQNIDCGNTLEPPRLTSTHNLCFGAKIRKICIPLQTPVFPVGFKRGYITRTCFRDEMPLWKACSP